MSEIDRKLLVLEAPAVLWRGVGALALSLTNVEGRPATPEVFQGVLFNTWTARWHDNDGTSYSLKVRDYPNGNAGPTTLFGLEPPVDTTELRMYTRYMFPSDAYTQSEIGYLAVFRNAIDPSRDDDPGAEKQQAAQTTAEIELGTAKGTLDDLGELSVKLWHGMMHMAADVQDGRDPI